MAFTGRFIRVGNANAFGANAHTPFGLAAIGNTLYMTDANNGGLYTVNTTTGVATIVGTAASGFRVGETRPYGLAAIGNTLYMVGSETRRLYTLSTSNGRARAVSSSQLGIFNPRGLAAIGNTLYVVTVSRPALYTINTTTGIATRIGSATNFSVGEGAPTGLASIGNTLYMVGQATDALYTLNTTTGVATRVDSSINFESVQSAVQDLASIGQDLYMVGRGPVALFIAEREPEEPTFTAPGSQSVNEGEKYSLDLSTVFSDATSYSLQAGNQAYVSIDGSTVSFTAPAVTTNTNINLLVTGTNAVGSTDATITVAIINVPKAPVYTAPDAQVINEGGSYSLDLSTVFASATSYSLQTGNQSYVSISGSTVSFTAPSVNADTTINLLVRATNSDGNTDASIPVLIKNVPRPPTFRSPGSQVVTEGQTYSLDLSDYYTGATAYSLRTGNQSYVTISGSVVSFRAPAVTEDITITLLVRGSNADGNNDQDIVVQIRNMPDVPVPVFTPPTANIRTNSGRRWTLDLAAVFSGATSYGFQSTYTKPDYLTLSRSRLIIETVPDVASETTLTILVQATNSGGTTPGTITLTILPMVQVPVLEGEAFDFQITILGVAIDKHAVESISNIYSGADFPYFGEFPLGDFSFTMIDIDGDFSPFNGNNFFISNGGTQQGIGSEVELNVIHNGEQILLFSGQIFNIRPGPGDATVAFECADASDPISRDNVENFGIDRRFKLAEETESQRERALEQRQPRENEVYPLLPALLPRSKGSATLYALSLEDTHEEVESLRRSGNLDYQRFVVTDNAVQTEGGRVPVTTQIATFPQIAYKSVHKNTHLMKLVEDLLTHYDISDRDIEIPTPTLDEHFSTNGRPDATLGIEQFDLTASYRTFITDFTYNAADTSYYFLMSINLNDGLNRSELVKYDITTYTWERVYRFAVGQKPWRLAIDGNFVYFFLSEDTVSPSLDPFNNLPQNVISRLTLSTSAYTVLANNASNLIPYMYRYYHLGNNPRDVLYRGLLPDSRASFLVHSSNLYYPYIVAPAEIGVATGTTKVFTTMSDGHENFAGISFAPRANTMWIAVTHRNGNNSQRNLWSVDISGL